MLASTVPPLAHEIACSGPRPPNTTATRILRSEFTPAPPCCLTLCCLTLCCLTLCCLTLCCLTLCCLTLCCLTLCCLTLCCLTLCCLTLCCLTLCCLTLWFRSAHPTHKPPGLLNPTGPLLRAGIPLPAPPGLSPGPASASRAWWTSAIRSSPSSRPIENRTAPGSIPAAARAASSN